MANTWTENLGFHPDERPPFNKGVVLFPPLAVTSRLVSASDRIGVIE